MKLRYVLALALLLCGRAWHPLIAVADDDDDKSGNSADVVTALNKEQQQAADIHIAHPVNARVPARTEAMGLVLDATTLIGEDGDLSVATAHARSTAAELARLNALYGSGGASQRILEAAQAEHSKSLADEGLAASRFALHWGPLLSLPAAARHKIIDDAGTGRSLLMRADLPGRHSLGELPDEALLDVDGIEVPGRVLGALRLSGDAQSAGLLIEAQNVPAGFGPGARVPVVLILAERKGLLLPRDAVLYDEHGAYVYKQVAATKGQPKTRYEAVKVRLLTPSGDGWLVDGLDDDDNIVVHGAGVLWALQGIGSRAADDDDD